MKHDFFVVLYQIQIFMKKYLFLLSLALLISCGNYNSINSFYNTHKGDANVTAFRVPHFMFSLLKSSKDGDLNNFINNASDIRFIQLSPKTDLESKAINTQINGLTSNRFVEVFRKNEDTRRTLISIRENRDVVKEIVIYKNGNKKNSIFYFKGNFDPNRIKQYVKDNKFDNLSNTVLQQFDYKPATSKN